MDKYSDRINWDLVLAGSLSLLIENWGLKNFHDMVCLLTSSSFDDFDYDFDLLNVF